MRPQFVLALVAWSSVGAAEPVTVNGAVTIQRPKGKPDHAGAVVTLRPLAPVALQPGHVAILQKEKRFQPHVTVVPVGSTVAFPNADPFFHNVFSLFNGKRFDLGLYEAGASRSTTFTRTGVCFIFCNIHPEMSAVVVVVDTPYYAVSNAAGQYAIAGVPAGRYEMTVWHERARVEGAGFPREVAVGPGSGLPAVTLIDSGRLSSAPHHNKYGHDYDPPASGGRYK